MMQWLRALGRWWWEAWPAWGAFVVIGAVALVATFLPGSADDRVRYTGMCLEIFGILTVAVGLRDKRRVFQRPSLIEMLQSWMQRFPRWTSESRTIGLTGVAAGGVVGSAYGYGWHGLPAEPKIEDRLNALEKNVETVKRLALDAQAQVQTEATKWGKEIEAEKLVRDASDKEIRDRLESFGAGNLHIEVVGIVWLIVGVVLATASQEVTWLFKLWK